MFVCHWCGKLASCLLAGCLMAPTSSIAGELMYLEVDTTNGQISWINQTGAPIEIDYYEITSALSALDATAWHSLQEQNLPGFPAGDGTGNGWEQAGGASAKVLGESFPLGQSTVANSASISLGAAFIVGGAHDLIFHYAVVPPSPVGDYNDDNVVDAADYTVWRDHLGQSIVVPNDSTPGVVAVEDYTEWKTNFGLIGGPTPPSILVTGDVQYFPPGSATALPEPSSVLLMGFALVSPPTVGGRRRRRPGVAALLDAEAPGELPLESCAAVLLWRALADAR